MPQGGQDITEGVVVRWLKAEGEAVRKGDVLCEVETEKAIFEVESPVDGMLLKIVAPAGRKVPIFSLIGIVGEAGEAFDLEAMIAEQAPQEQRPDVTAIRRRLAAGEGAPRDRAKASGRARKLAAEKGVDLERIAGSGPRGRITSQDVLIHVEKCRLKVTALEGRALPMSRMRRAIARNVALSKQTIPHFYVTVAVDVSEALGLREVLRAAGREISITDLVVRAAALTLREFPAVNGRVQDDQFLAFEDVNIGLAVALDEGLVVPVLPRADALRLDEIARLSRELVARAREGRQANLVPGTFTVSNLGMLGVDNFIAIINPPETGILAVGAVRRQPVAAEDDSIRIRSMMQITLSSDHRVVDGALAARFIAGIRQRLEDPRQLLD
jgi:pyruvate dehydrogenase E2 component (dihydrolipoamide acetyltransferase)